MKVNFYDLTFRELEKLVRTHELSSYAPRLLFNLYYKKDEPGPLHGQLKQETISYLEENLSFELPSIDKVVESSDGTVKFLLKLHDGKTVETVLLPFLNKFSLCVSSQVGCAMNCSFCFTGKQGFSRHLKTHEIVGQFVAAKRWLANKKIKTQILSVVFMGQGEPLHNFDEVKKACEVFTSSYGMSMAQQKITISTAGYLPGIERFVQDDLGVNLALSLHSADPDTRGELIPINRPYPLPTVLAAIDRIPLRKKQFVIYEYLLIEGLNDQREDALATATLLRGKRAQISLIPFNPFPGSRYKRPSTAATLQFKNWLEENGVVTLIRGTKGDDVLAACGQLNTYASSSIQR